MSKPPECSRCALERIGRGFARPVGPLNSPFYFLGESLGAEEVWQGQPFVGPAGGMLNRVLYDAGIDRGTLRLGNLVSCFPGDTKVEARGIEKGYRRWYSGDLVSVKTAAARLSGTPNHPVLTPRGWVPMGELQKGDHLVRGSFDERSSPGDPNVYHRPAMFAETFKTLALDAVREWVIGSNVDFHGDGGESKIDVVTHNGLLGDRGQVPLSQHPAKDLLKAADEVGTVLPSTCPGCGAPLEYRSGDPSPPDRGVSGLGQLQPSLPPEPLESKTLGLSMATEGNPRLDERSLQPPLPDSITPGKRLQPGPTQVGFAEILEIERSWFSGHVYNLQTNSGEYIAEGFIVHNCQPPENKLDKWQGAVERCKATYLQPDIEQWLRAPSPTGEKVLVALGGHAMRNVLNLQRKGTRVQDFHGSVIRDPTNRFNVVCSYHPSFIQRGAYNLLDVMRYDLTVAKEAAISGFVPEEVALFLDPTFAFFEHWADEYIAAATKDPERTWLAVDIETPDKAKKTDEGELKLSDRSYHIIRINFSYHTDEAVTVPWTEPYIRVIKKILAAPGAKIFWNAPYDVPRLKFNSAPIAEPILDFMWAWHVLQSDLPRGLGFVAPFYSKLGPWKHWSADDPVRYAAMDAVQTLRIAYGVAEQLEAEGMWDVFWRHVYELDTKVLHPAEDVGLLVDLEELARLKERLDLTAGRIGGEVQALVPDAVKPLVPKGGLARHPGLEYDEAGVEVPIYEAEVKVIGKVCEACSAEQITVKHRCKDKELQPKVVARELTVKRYYRQEAFNPGSPVQLMAYILHQGHTPGVDKKTKKPTTNKDTLDKLVKSTDDPLYPKILELRSVDKVRKTYVNGSYDKLATDPRSVLDGRLHPSFLHKPSSLRLSCQSPNLQNVIADRGAYTSLAGGFRFCLIAAPGCKLLEVDFSGIEAVLSGWFMGDPRYIRMAKLSIHAFVTSHLVGEPPEDSWDDAQLASWFAYIKEKYPHEYDQCKRYVHGTNYGLTIFGMVKQFPKEFPNIKAAERIAAIYAKIAPGLAQWHLQVRDQAAKETLLGGKTHPFGYRHWFFNVVSYQIVRGVARKGAQIVRMNGTNYEMKLGEDAKRAVSFFPQSSAAGIIKEAMLRLFDPEMPNYIGDAFYGRTPLRAQIHDSLLLEVPDELVDVVLEKLVIEMTRPIPEFPMPEEWGLGPYLSIGVEAKVGQNWAGYNDKAEDREGRPLRLNLAGMRKVKLPESLPTLAGDVPVPFDEYDEAEEEVEAAGEFASA